jgi:hypothetical protein
MLKSYKRVKMDKIGYFKDELSYIVNPKIKEFAEKSVNSLPDYFWEIPASSTGKYHPAYSLGEGGLARHTRSAVRIAVELSRLDWWHWEADEMDLCIAALLIHDGYKSGIVQEKYSRADHPNIIAGRLMVDDNLNSILPREQFDIVLGLVSKHMGQWNFDWKTKAPIMEKPKSKLEKFVHLCDYLASRKCLEMNFEVELSKE